jgi:hypothetical protein
VRARGGLGAVNVRQRLAAQVCWLDALCHCKSYPAVVHAQQAHLYSVLDSCKLVDARAPTPVPPDPVHTPIPQASDSVMQLRNTSDAYLMQIDIFPSADIVACAARSIHYIHAEACRTQHAQDSSPCQHSASSCLHTMRWDVLSVSCAQFQDAHAAPGHAQVQLLCASAGPARMPRLALCSMPQKHGIACPQRLQLD